MKKIYIIAVLAVFAATSALALSVVNSRHDMVTSGFAIGLGGSTEVCIFCHTPHGAQVSVTQAPLWNNTAVANVGTLYNSTTMNFAVTQGQVNATDARLCLACHDGGVGMPVNHPNSGDMDPTGAVMAANALLGINMSNDHPIGMDLGANPGGVDVRYDGVANLRSIATIRGATGFNEDPFYGGSKNDNVNIMWCSTCHDVHDNEHDPFLRISNAGSAMCKACHIK